MRSCVEEIRAVQAGMPVKNTVWRVVVRPVPIDVVMRWRLFWPTVVDWVKGSRRATVGILSVVRLEAVSRANEFRSIIVMGIHRTRPLNSFVCHLQMEQASPLSIRCGNSLALKGIWLLDRHFPVIAPQVGIGTC